MPENEPYDELVRVEQESLRREYLRMEARRARLFGLAARGSSPGEAASGSTDAPKPPQ